MPVVSHASFINIIYSPSCLVDHKAKIRSDCWEAFRENFPSEEDCRDALGLFEQVRQIDEACKGQSIAARQKVFFSTFSKLFQLVRISSQVKLMCR